MRSKPGSASSATYQNLMSSLIIIFLSSFFVAFSGALMPGPLMTVTVSESFRRGASAGPLMILGHGILELALVLALLSGMAPYFEKQGVFIVIALFGGGILLWMAVSMLRSLPQLRLDFDVQKNNNDKSKNLVMSGIILSLANPYWTIWWVSIGLGYILHSRTFGIAGVVAFFVGHILADFLWYSLISYVVARGKSFFSNGFYRGLIGTCASVLLVFACYFFYSGLEKLV